MENEKIIRIVIQELEDRTPSINFAKLSINILDRKPITHLFNPTFSFRRFGQEDKIIERREEREEIFRQNSKMIFFH